ncbi:hypothetical protein F4815DRAFT_503359 [Daldinia loculata]|nr:hypothetical protein F4815DRAFT_503359 [Daldinia loculata]
MANKLSKEFGPVHHSHLVHCRTSKILQNIVSHPATRTWLLQGRKIRIKPARTFDTGSTNALPNVDLASGIFEAPSAIQPEAQMTESVSVTGGPLDKQASGRSTAGEEQKSTSRTQEVNSDGSISRKPKDTAGAGAMIL